MMETRFWVPAGATVEIEYERSHRQVLTAQTGSYWDLADLKDVRHVRVDGQKVF